MGARQLHTIYVQAPGHHLQNHNRLDQPPLNSLQFNLHQTEIYQVHSNAITLQLTERLFRIF